MSARDHTVTKVVLKNGAEGLFIDIPTATVMGLLFNFRAGYFLMGDEKWETPHIMEHMSFGANKQFKKARLFQAEYGKNGAYWNATTDDYHINYETECADFEWERVLEMMLLSVSRPVFLEEEFQAECGNVRDELIGRGNNRGLYLSIAISKAFGLRSHQYTERVDLMNSILLSDITLHHKKTHTTSNLRFVIAGNLSGRMKKIEKMLETIDLPKGDGRLELPEEKATSFKKPVYVEKLDVPNVFFEVVSYVPGKFNDMQWTAAGMITNLLTGTLYSKILGEARERGLVYGVGSNFLYTKTDIGWWLSGQAQAANLPELARITEREIGKVVNGKIALKDIDAARQYMLGSFQRSAQTVFAVAKGYAGRYFFENTIEDYYGLPDRANKVTKVDIENVATKIFGPAQWGMGLLGTAPGKLGSEVQSILKPLWQK